MKIPLGDFIRAVFAGKWLGRIFGYTKGVSINVGDHEVQLNEGHGPAKPESKFDKPHRPGPTGIARANLVWLLAIGSLVAYDIAMVACNSTPGDTLSEGIWSLSLSPGSLFLGLAIGVVLGHLFWSRGK